MKKRILILTIILAASTLTACGADEQVSSMGVDSISDISSLTSAQSSNDSKRTTQLGGTKVTEACYDISKAFNEDGYTVSYFKIKGNVIYIVRRNAENLQFSTYDLQTLKLKNKIKFYSESRFQNFGAYNGGLFVLEKESFSKNSHCQLTVYDQTLSLVHNTDVTELFKDEMMLPAFTLSNSGKELYVATRGGLCKSSVAKPNKQMIYPFKMSEFTPSDIIGFPKISMSKDDKTLYFIGSSFPADGQESVDGIGSMDCDGKSINYQVPRGYDGVNMSTSDNGTLFFETTKELKKTSTGKIYFLNQLGTVQEITLENKNESQDAVISDSGEYIATFLPMIQGGKNLSLQLRIYKTDTQKMIFKTDTFFPEILNAPITGVSFDDKKRQLYVVYRLSPDKIYVYQF